MTYYSLNGRDYRHVTADTCLVNGMLRSLNTDCRYYFSPNYCCASIHYRRKICT